MSTNLASHVASKQSRNGNANYVGIRVYNVLLRVPAHMMLCMYVTVRSAALGLDILGINNICNVNQY